MSTPHRVVYVSCANEKQAQEIASALVENNLAACVSIIGPVHSVYRWEGSIQQECEYLLMIKTTDPCVSALQEAVLKLHSYTIPEVIVLPILGGNPHYLDWVMENTRSD